MAYYGFLPTVGFVTGPTVTLSATRPSTHTTIGYTVVNGVLCEVSQRDPKKETPSFASDSASEVETYTNAATEAWKRRYGFC